MNENDVDDICKALTEGYNQAFALAVLEHTHKKKSDFKKVFLQQIQKSLQTTKMIMLARALEGRSE